MRKSKVALHRFYYKSFRMNVFLFTICGTFLIAGCTISADTPKNKVAEWYPCVEANNEFRIFACSSDTSYRFSTRASYTLFYIGKKESVIHPNPFFRSSLDSIDYMMIAFQSTGITHSSREKPKFEYSKNARYNPKNAAHVVGRNAYDKYAYSLTALRIFVDTTQMVNSCYPVFVTNQWIDTVILCTGDYLPFWLEAKNKNGDWQPLQERHFYGCGTGLKTFILPPKEIVLSFLRKPQGRFNTKIRLTNGFIQSNSIQASIADDWLTALPAYDR